MLQRSKIIVLGNGPSLRDIEIGNIVSVPTLGMNAAYRYWDKINWYPDIYCCLDDQVVDSHADEIFRLYSERKCKLFFLHPNILNRHKELSQARNVYFLSQFLGGKTHDAIRSTYGLRHIESFYFTSKRPSKLTTGSYAVRFCLFLGYTDILLLGIDCQYVEIIPEAELVDGIKLKIKTSPDRNANYFFDDYQRAGDVYNIPNPTVHSGNLHLQSFEAIKEDIERWKLNVAISIGTTKSEIYRTNLFPYRRPAPFLKKTLDAIFIPTHAADIDAVVHMLQSWARSATIPSFTSTPSIDICIASSGTRNETVEAVIADAFNELTEAHPVFRSLRFFYSELSGLTDIYDKTKSKPVTLEGYAAGPNNQNFDILLRFSVGYSHIMIMETDCVPLRVGWLDSLRELCEASEDFWIAGTAYDGTGIVKAFFHINGNAIYNVGSSDFIDFIKDNMLRHFYKKALNAEFISYDVILYDLFIPVFRGDDNLELHVLWKNALKNFKFTKLIMNKSLDQDKGLLKSQGLVRMAESSPEAVLLHGLPLQNLK